MCRRYSSAKKYHEEQLPSLLDACMGVCQCRAAFLACETGSGAEMHASWLTLSPLTGAS